MRLTNSMRDAFIADVMARLPSVDYVEQIHEVIQTDALEQLPAVVEEWWASRDFRPYVNTSYFHSGYSGISSVVVPCKGGESFQLTAPAREEVRRLAALKSKQTERDNELKARLKAVAYGCSTLKQLQESLPEFKDQMPEDEGKALRSLPVVKGVYEAFKQEGWPDG